MAWWASSLTQEVRDLFLFGLQIFEPGIMNELKNDLFNIDRKFMLPYGILWCAIMILVVFDTREEI